MYAVAAKTMANIKAIIAAVPVICFVMYSTKMTIATTKRINRSEFPTFLFMIVFFSKLSLFFNI